MRNYYNVKDFHTNPLIEQAEDRLSCFMKIKGKNIDSMSQWRQSRNKSEIKSRTNTSNLQDYSEHNQMQFKFLTSSMERDKKS